VTNFYVRQELKEWGYFQAGSQWLYRNDSTGEKENVFETGIQEDRMIGGGDVSHNDEQITVSFNSTFLTGYILGFDCNGSYAVDNTAAYTDKVQLSLVINTENWPMVAIWPDETYNEDETCRHINISESGFLC